MFGINVNYVEHIIILSSEIKNELQIDSKNIIKYKMFIKGFAI